MQIRIYNRLRANWNIKHSHTYDDITECLSSWKDYTFIVRTRKEEDILRGFAIMAGIDLNIGRRGKMPHRPQLHWYVELSQ